MKAYTPFILRAGPPQALISRLPASIPTLATIWTMPNTLAGLKERTSGVINTVERPNRKFTTA